MSRVMVRAEIGEGSGNEVWTIALNCCPMTRGTSGYSHWRNR